jgi:FAD/FMN-containing dehydrogenase
MRAGRRAAMLPGMLLLSENPTIHRFTGTLAETAGGLIAHCSSVADVAAALAHPAPVQIDVSALRAIHVDPERRVAWVQPGATRSELEAVLGEHGLAADDLRAVRLVTEAGPVATASPTMNPELFRAARDGAADGIVVELEFDLAPTT